MEDEKQIRQHKKKVHDNFLGMDVYKLPILEAVYCPKTKKVQEINCAFCPHKFGFERVSKLVWCIFPDTKEPKSNGCDK
jgi:hypothetical protein